VPAAEGRILLVISIVTGPHTADSLRGCPTVSCAHIGVCGLSLRILVPLAVGVSVAIWTGHVPDDLGGLVFVGRRVELAVDCGEGAEELIGDVGEDGGAARGDFLLGEKEEKAGEEVVDGDGGTELLEIGGEGGGGVSGFPLVLDTSGVSGAVGGVHVGGEEAATHAIGVAMGAASGVVDGAGFSRLLGHFSFLCELNWGDTPRDLYGCETKGVAGKGICKVMKTKGQQIEWLAIHTWRRKKGGAKRGHCQQNLN